VPAVRDELRYVVRHDLMMNTQRTRSPSATTFRSRHCRCAGSARSCPGTSSALGGALERPHLALDRHGIQGAQPLRAALRQEVHPADMTIQDWGITYDELEPYYDKFEYTAAFRARRGNIRGVIQPGGNPSRRRASATIACRRSRRCSRRRCSGRRRRQRL